MSEPEPLKVIHCLSFLYLAFAHQTDGELSDDERSVIRTKLQEWCSEGTDMSTISTFMDETIGWYNAVEADDRINTMAGIAATLKDEGFTEDQRRAVVADLVSIAKADGNYDETERKWVKLLAADMEV